MSRLVVTSGEMKDRSFELNASRITVGRLPENQICLNNGGVSSHHAELIKKGDHYFLRDLNSTNGTRVNEHRIVETQLSDGDNVNFGPLQMQYFSDVKGASQPLPSPSKKAVDLSKAPTSAVTRPISYGSVSPFAKKRNVSKLLLQIAVIVFGLIAITLLSLFVTKIFN